MGSHKEIRQGVSFDDVLLLPAYSDILPAECDVYTQLTARIKLNIPLLSAAMDTVSEAATAICLARLGGIGIIHKNLDPKAQAREVLQVKKAESGIVVDPLTVNPDHTLAHALKLMRRNSFSGLPVVEGKRVVVQGLGNVGYHAAKYLQQGGALLVGLAEIEGAIHAPGGLDLEKVIAHRTEHGTLLDFPGAQNILPSSAALELECDILVPAAMEKQITMENVGNIKTKIIGEAANGPTTTDAER